MGCSVHITHTQPLPRGPAPVPETSLSFTRIQTVALNQASGVLDAWAFCAACRLHARARPQRPSLENGNDSTAVCLSAGRREHRVHENASRGSCYTDATLHTGREASWGADLLLFLSVVVACIRVPLPAGACTAWALSDRVGRSTLDWPIGCRRKRSPVLILANASNSLKRNLSRLIFFFSFFCQFKPHPAHFHFP